MPTSQGKKASVPGGFISNWQSSQGQNAKRPVRRPMTACDTCRTAKVKCDNSQPKCERCTTRGVSCTYSAINSDARSNSSSRAGPAHRPPRQHQAQPSPATTSIHSQQTSTLLPTPSDSFPNDIAMHLNTDMFDGLYEDDFLSMGASENLIEWSHELGEQLGHSRLEPEHPEPNFSNDLTVTHNTVSPIQQGQTYTRSQRDPSIMQAFQTLGSDCPCRGLLLTQVPRVKVALQQLPQPKLGHVFKATQDVIQSCQNLIECTHCRLNWSDILCMVAVFQSTQACYQCLVRADADEVIKVSIDDCEISLYNSATLRRLLVVDLLKRASTFLAALNTLGAKIMKQDLPVGSLCCINLQFLTSAISDCEAILQSASSSVDYSVDDSQSGTDSLVNGMVD